MTPHAHELRPLPSGGAESDGGTVLLTHCEGSLGDEVREALATAFEVVRAGHARKTRTIVAELRPDVLVIGLEPAEASTLLGFVAEMAIEHAIPAVVVTATADPRWLRRLRGAGIVGCVVRPFSRTQLRVSVEMALGHRQALLDARASADARVRLGRLEEAFVKTMDVLRETGLVLPEAPRRAALPSLVALFSPRERQVLELLMAHKRPKSIAGALGISASTVRNHLKSMFAKVGVSSQEELLERLLED